MRTVKTPIRKARKPSQQRAHATVEVILEAAARILERDGSWHGFSTNRIAREAGVSIGSLYEYFEGKDAIVKALCERHVARVKALMDLAFDELRGASIEHAVAHVLDGLFLLHDARPDLQRTLHLEFPRQFGLDPLIESDRYIEAKLVDWLAERWPGVARSELSARAFVAIRAGRTVTIHAFAEGLPAERKAQVRAVIIETITRLLASPRAPSG